MRTVAVSLQQASTMFVLPGRRSHIGCVSHGSLGIGSIFYEYVSLTSLRVKLFWFFSPRPAVNTHGLSRAQLQRYPTSSFSTTIKGFIRALHGQCRIIPYGAPPPIRYNLRKKRWASRHRSLYCTNEGYAFIQCIFS
jgi:hypothetical protein